MARGPGGLFATTKPDVDHIGNDFETIEGLVVYLKTQIGDWLTHLDPKKV